MYFFFANEYPLHMLKYALWPSSFFLSKIFILIFIFLKPLKVRIIQSINIIKISIDIWIYYCIKVWYKSMIHNTVKIMLNIFYLLCKRCYLQSHTRHLLQPRGLVHYKGMPPYYFFLSQAVCMTIDSRCNTRWLAEGDVRQGANLSPTFFDLCY